MRTNWAAEGEGTAFSVSNLTAQYEAAVITIQRHARGLVVRKAVKAGGGRT